LAGDFELARMLAFAEPLHVGDSTELRVWEWNATLFTSVSRKAFAFRHDAGLP
jgi:hypothetical protein